MKKEAEKIPYEDYKKIRGSWNGVNPVTRIIPDKKKYSRKAKHKTDWRR